MENGSDKLHLLSHSLGEFFHLFVPPILYFKFLEPKFQCFQGILFGHPLEACQVNGLLAHFHFFVQSALFRQISDQTDIFRLEFFPVEQHFAAIGSSNTIDDADERGFTGTVRPEQTVNCSFWNIQTHSVQCAVSGILLYDVFYFY